MNENLIYELKKKTKELKLEIINKEQELDSLISEYQELTEEDIKEDMQ